MKRKRFEHEGRLVYEWEQDIEQVEMWVTPPSGVTAKMIACAITSNHFSLGIKGNPPFIDEDLHATVVVDESMWMMEDGVLHVIFQKMSLAETWPSLLKGHANLNSVEQEQETQKILLERFQREVWRKTNKRTERHPWARGNETCGSLFLPLLCARCVPSSILVSISVKQTSLDKRPTPRSFWEDSIQTRSKESRERRNGPESSRVASLAIASIAAHRSLFSSSLQHSRAFKISHTRSSSQHFANSSSRSRHASIARSQLPYAWPAAAAASSSSRARRKLKPQIDQNSKSRSAARLRKGSVLLHIELAKLHEFTRDKHGMTRAQ